ncbi:MAG: zinc-binding dehydrogenase [Oscillospiraceae bacterium]|nr:zinc-binding dehydrogenase [Oscillospiraceae bacterium]
MRVKLAVAPKMGKEIVVEEVELAEPGPNDVRIKVMTCTICHSDIHGLDGEHGEYDGPGSAGHEIAGIVDAVGEQVTYVKPGDRVLSSLIRQGCGNCVQCYNDRHWFCENIPPMSFRELSPFTRLNGERIVQTMSGASGFATYCNTHESAVCKVDDDIPFEIASILACGFMSGFGAVLNRSQPKPGQSYAVVGCGGVGLSAIMGAKYCGCVPIIAIDINPAKLELAKKYGATHCINPKETKDVVKAVHEITKGNAKVGYGVDHSMVAVAGKVKRMTYDITAPYGQMVVVGHGHPRNEQMDEFNFMEVLLSKKITGCVMGGITLRRDVPLYMEMYRTGQVDLDSFITKKYKLDDIKEAIDDAENGSPIKNVIICNEA